MNIAVSTWCFRQQPIFEALRQISLLGVRHVELFANRFHLDPRLGPVSAAEIRAALEHYNLAPASLHAPFSMVEVRGSAMMVKESWVGLIRETLETASALEAPSVIVHPQVLSLEDGVQPRAIDVTGLVLNVILPIACGLGLRILFENLPGIIYDCYHSMRELLDLAGRIGDDMLGICLDTSHLLCCGLDPLSEIRDAGMRLFEIHASDNLSDAKSDAHLPVGQGCIHWPSLVAGMKEAGFSGNITLEIDGGADAFGATWASLEALKKAFDSPG